MKKINYGLTWIMIIGLGLFGYVIHVNSSFFLLSKEKLNALEQKIKIPDSFLELETYLKKWIGIREKNGVYFGKNDVLFEQPKEIKNKDQWIFKWNTFYKEHNSINMSLILVPSHVMIDQDLLDSDIPIFDQYEQIKSIYHKITFNTIDIVPILKEKNKEYNMYYKMDSNLTSYGAFYITQKYAEVGDLQILSLEDFDLKEGDSFSGNLLKKVHMFSKPKDSIVLFFPKQEQTLEMDGKKITNVEIATMKKSKYVISNKTSENKKELLVIIDDTTSMMIPFLIHYYSKVHVFCTKDLSSVSAYLEKENQIKDVVFIYSMNQLE